MIRHFLAALAYRFQKSIRDAPKGFANFEVGHGVRTPLAIVHHLNGVLGYGRVVLETGDADYRHQHPQLDWQGEIAQLHATLQEIDTILTAAQHLTTDRLQRLLQGPLSDAMTHVGQLAMLRRLANSPIHGENFFKAAIAAGRLGEDQADPVSPDP